MAEPDDQTQGRRNGVIAAAVGLAVVLILILWWLFSGPSPVDWAATTVPYDPECGTDCEIVGFVTPGHRGPAAPLKLNPNVDDPIAQWAGCIQLFTECMEETPDALACMDQGPCPSACKSEYARVASNASDLEGLLAAFQTVFLEEEAYCRPQEEGAP